jgi:hypothetical protein
MQTRDSPDPIFSTPYFQSIANHWHDLPEFYKQKEGFDNI